MVPCVSRALVVFVIYKCNCIISRLRNTFKGFRTVTTSREEKNSCLHSRVCVQHTRVNRTRCKHREIHTVRLAKFPGPGTVPFFTLYAESPRAIMSFDPRNRISGGGGGVVGQRPGVTPDLFDIRVRARIFHIATAATAAASNYVPRTLRLPEHVYNCTRCDETVVFRGTRYARTRRHVRRQRRPRQHVAACGRTASCRDSELDFAGARSGIM